MLTQKQILNKMKIALEISERISQIKRGDYIADHSFQKKELTNLEKSLQYVLRRIHYGLRFYAPIPDGWDLEER